MISAELATALAGGIALTLGMTALTTVASLLLAFRLTEARMSPRRVVRLPATIVVEVFRNVPALVQIIFWAFAVPNLFTADTRRAVFFDNAVMDALGAVTGLPLPYYGLAAAIGLTLNTTGHLTEILRSGVGSMPGEHLDAARTLGASRRTAMRRVLLPTGFRTTFPAISSRLVHNMKNTALASFVAVPELFGVIQGEITRTFDATRLLLLGAAVYLVLAWLMTVVLDVVDRRLRPAGSVAGGG
ncbi:MAG: amino acid ABC transporter permease [Actinomycetota bacterium]